MIQNRFGIQTRISKNIVTVEAHIEHVPESAFSVILDKIEK